MPAYASVAAEASFAASYTRFDGLVAWLTGDQAAGMTHGELEERLHTEGLGLLRQLLQDSLDLRAVREQRLVEVIDAGGHHRGVAERGHGRALATRFGQVTVTRIAYRARGLANLHPADAGLNLPVEKHSHGLRRLAALEATRGSFADAATAIGRATGVRLGRRQAEQLTARAAVDVDAFYAAHAADPAPKAVLVLSFDGKGVVMRPDGLREPTAKAATSQKLATRLSKGEKRNRKRMAEVAAVYDQTPVPRTIADILPWDPQGQPNPGPAASGKWLTASVSHDAATVIAAGFAEATRRDPDHQRTWVALVDGNTHQIDRIHAEAHTHHVDVDIIVDFIHVLEYVSAPRGARLYPPSSGEGLEEHLWVRWLTRNPKGKGDNSMPANRGHAQAYGVAYRGTRVIWRKLDCPESQCPEGASRTPAGKTPETDAASCTRSHRCRVQPPERGTMPSEGIQGHEWGAYVTLLRTTGTNVGSPNGRESYGDTVPVVVAGVTTCQGGREGRPQGQGAQVIGHQQP